jgi:molecular chaperone GrpE
MSDDTSPKNETPETDALGEALAAAAKDGIEAKTATAEAIELEVARGEVADLRDKLLRTLADMENLRRRTEKEVKDARDYAVTGLARDLLNVTDTFGRAIAALPEELKTAEGAVKSFVDGIEMTARELTRALEKAGVKKIEAMGAKFDPNQHQAMFEQPVDGPSGLVVQVLQEGFLIGERVLRPALVGVSKAMAKPADQAPVDKTV